MINLKNHIKSEQELVYQDLMGLRKCFFKGILENEKVRFKAKEKGRENDLFEKKLGFKQKKNTSVCLDKGVFLLMKITITIFVDMLDEGLILSV